MVSRQAAPRRAKSLDGESAARAPRMPRLLVPTKGVPARQVMRPSSARQREVVWLGPSKGSIDYLSYGQQSRVKVRVHPGPDGSFRESRLIHLVSATGREFQFTACESSRWPTLGAAANGCHRVDGLRMAGS